MMDLIKALLLGAVLVAGFFAIPVVVALLVPLLCFGVIVFIIWIILQVLKSDDKPPTDPPP